jgi:hypothetical protein
MFQRINPAVASAVAILLGAAPVQAIQPDTADKAPAAEAGADQGEPVAVFAMRQSVLLRAGDEHVLKQGLSLHIASMGGVMTIVEYSVKDGKIVYTVTSGSIHDKTRKAIDKAVAKLQKKM